ncbi:MAG: YceH family protein [Casimicrobiaceae bacterium]|nr:YceH family protein [Casimicrobiaceae bacterium]MCX8097402.1 YceH family protein [Casimicrobiaceae bacterium]MDW8312035.1 YceH family protein [Burkholderiales bacterium]
MEAMFDAVELRVLGTMLEKRATVPDVYPMTVNALVHGCNQLNNRNPVMNLSESEVTAALERLRERGFVGLYTGAATRVPKYTVALGEKLGLKPPELALLTELILRGPQTPGELRQHAERLHAFGSLAELEETLAALSVLAPPLVVRLPKEPGARAYQWMHTLGGVDFEALAQAPSESTAPRPAAAESSLAGRLSAVEARVAALEAQLAALREQLGG